MPAKTKTDAAAVGRLSARSRQRTQWQLVATALLSLTPIIPLWFSGVSCVAYRDTEHVNVWILQQGHGRIFHFTADQGRFTHQLTALESKLYWLSHHVEFSFAAAPLNTLTAQPLAAQTLAPLSAQLEQLRQGNSRWAYRYDLLHVLTFVLLLGALYAWWRLWRNTP